MLIRVKLHAFVFYPLKVNICEGWMKFHDFIAKIKYIQVTEKSNFSKSDAPVWVQFKIKTFFSPLVHI